MSIWGDIFSGDTLAGIGSGAATGLMVGGPWGALAGGLAGGAIGAYAHDKKDQATAGQQKNLQQVMANLQAMQSTAYTQHIADTQKALNYFGPAQNYWTRLYGQGAPAQTGQADWGNTGLK